MTLIVYVKCADAAILATDKKESNTSDVGQGILKYYMPTNKEFVLALAGEGTRIDLIFSELRRNPDITGATVSNDLHRIMTETRANIRDSMASGLLLVRDGDDFEFNEVWGTENQTSITKNEPPFKHYGNGSYLVDYLIRKFDLPGKPWKESCPRLIEIMDDVAERADSVGGVNDYGIDLLVFTNDEVLVETIRSTDGIGKIECKCDTKNWPGLQSKTPKSMPQGMIKNSMAANGATVTINAGGGDYRIGYQISSGKVTSVEPLEDACSLLISLDVVDDGELTVTMPRSLIDSMAGDHNDKFIVLHDGEETQVRETVASKDRTVTVPFAAGCKKIEIIGNEMFGGRTDSGRNAVGYDATEIDRVARQRDSPIAIQTDKDTYAYGSDIIVTITNPYFATGEQMSLSVTDDAENVTYKSMIPVSEGETGIYQEIIRMAGRQWTKSGTAFRINVKYQDKQAGVGITMRPPEMSIKMDKESYSWTAKAYLTVTVPGLLRSPSSAAKLSDVSGCLLEISTSRGTLRGYDLAEAEGGLGIFTGQVRLTGFPGHDAHGNGRGGLVSGKTCGSGPTDGRIGCLRNDTLTVTLITNAGRVGSSAPIRWHVGDARWLKAAYPSSGTGTLQVVDPDMSLDPEKRNEVEARVWSDSDPTGIRLWLQEIRPATGIFNGDVHFTKEPSSGQNLKVSDGDQVIAEYIDRTLPDPHPIHGKQEIYCSSLIRDQNPSTKEVTSENAPPSKLPSTPIVSMPAGTSVPGCEECDNCFVPSSITVRVNQTVIWSNDDNVVHIIASGTIDEGLDGNFDSGHILPGSSFSHKFVRKGTYHYFSYVHPWQAGVVVVE